jgi:type I restriction enzyme R subunit
VVLVEEESTLTILDEATGEEIQFEKVDIRRPDGSRPDGSWVKKGAKREKVVVNGVDVSILVSRDLYFDQNGKPITVSLKDHTREIIKGQFATLNDFINKWAATERKEVIIKELQEQGVMVEALQEAVDKKIDLFDLICHVAYDQPPLTGRDRANNVRKRNYFTKYGEQARNVLETLLDKYADEGIVNIESIDVKKVKLLTDFGSPLEIISKVGNKEKYLQAVNELKLELYKIA